MCNTKMEQENAMDGRRDRFVASVERFVGLLLDRLAESPSGKMMDEKETRMLGSVVMRSYHIWMKALALQGKDPALEEKLRRLRKQVSETRE
jgi:hypothetical protein